MTLGLVCDACDALSPITVGRCHSCGAPLGVVGRENSLSGHADPSSPTAAENAPPADRDQGQPGGQTPQPPLGEESASAGEPPEQMRRCHICGEVMPVSHRFCGSCGERFDVPDPAAPALPQPPQSSRATQFFGQIQQARARLVLIRGENADGIAYHLAGAEHVAGRIEGAILFPEDNLLSPRHANFFYRDGALLVRDEGSQNGVFVRIRKPAPLVADQPFLIGEQLLVVRPAPGASAAQPDPEGTFFYGSPRRAARLHIVQLLSGGQVGMVVRCAGPSVTIGREGNQVNFPDDPFISGHHAQVTALDDKRFQLEDLRSKNGTFVRVRGETRLEHGDYVFLGQQLLRVEIT